MPEPAPERRELPATMLEPCSFDDTPERERTPPDDTESRCRNHPDEPCTCPDTEWHHAEPEPTAPVTAEDLTSPAVAGPTYAAVYEVIRKWPGTAERNAVIWRAVQAYQAALMVDPTTGRHPLEALIEIRCGHTRHQWMCVNCAADAVRPEVERLQGEVAQLRERLGQYELDEQQDALATAGAFDEEDPF